MLSAVRQNMSVWIQKLECGGDVEKQHHFKKRFVSRLRHSSIAVDTDKANKQHYEVPTDFFLMVTSLGHDMIQPLVQ